MTEQHRCIKESVLGDMKMETRVLMKDFSENKGRLERLEKQFEDLSTISTAVSVMSVSLEHIVEHNHKQDILVREQSQTLGKINENLNKLNQGQLILDERVINLEKRVDENESLNRIDLRKLRQESQTGILRRYAVPVGLGATAAAIIIELLKFLQ